MTALEKFMALAIPEPNTGCWLWMGTVCPRVTWLDSAITWRQYIVLHVALWLFAFLGRAFNHWVRNAS